MRHDHSDDDDDNTIDRHDFYNDGFGGNDWGFDDTESMTNVIIIIDVYRSFKWQQADSRWARSTKLNIRSGYRLIRLIIR